MKKKLNNIYGIENKKIHVLPIFDSNKIISKKTTVSGGVGKPKSGAMNFPGGNLSHSLKSLSINCLS